MGSDALSRCGGAVKVNSCHWMFFSSLCLSQLSFRICIMETLTYVLFSFLVSYINGALVPLSKDRLRQNGICFAFEPG